MNIRFLRKSLKTISQVSLISPKHSSHYIFKEIAHQQAENDLVRMDRLVRCRGCGKQEVSPARWVSCGGEGGLIAPARSQSTNSMKDLAVPCTSLISNKDSILLMFAV